MLTLLLCALAHGSKTWAGDGTAVDDALLPNKNVRPLPGLTTSKTMAAPDPFALPTVLDAPALTTHLSPGVADDFSDSEFRPRKRAQRNPAAPDYGSGDPMFRTTTVWQRLNEFRAQDRVRVLTLLEMGGSNLSLQTSKRGDPSLQWTSSWTGRSQVSRGLLDRVLAATLNGMVNRGNSAHAGTPSSTQVKPLLPTPLPTTK